MYASPGCKCVDIGVVLFFLPRLLQVPFQANIILCIYDYTEKERKKKAYTTTPHAPCNKLTKHTMTMQETTSKCQALKYHEEFVVIVIMIIIA